MAAEVHKNSTALSLVSFACSPRPARSRSLGPAAAAAASWSL